MDSRSSKSFVSHFNRSQWPRMYFDQETLGKWEMAVFHVSSTFDQSIRIKPNFFAYSRSHKRNRPDCKSQEGCWCDLSLGSSRLLTFQPLLISWISESGQIKIHFIFWKSISMRIQHILLILFYINMLQTSVRVDDVVVSMLQVQSVETWFLLIKINSFWIGQQYFLIILDGLCLILRRILTFMSIRTIVDTSVCVFPGF